MGYSNEWEAIIRRRPGLMRTRPTELALIKKTEKRRQIDGASAAAADALTNGGRWRWRRERWRDGWPEQAKGGFAE